MGIEIRCPKGHEVRVKDRFAGKKIYCPECGATVRVPGADRPAAPPTAAIVSLDATYAAGLPRAVAVARREDRKPVVRPGADRAAASAAGPVAAPGKPGLHPVIAEAADIPWNVALPGGDPSEPLDGETLQEWLDSGAVTGDELVWRADWPDWVPIRLVFPEHLPGAQT